MASTAIGHGKQLQLDMASSGSC